MSRLRLWLAPIPSSEYDIERVTWISLQGSCNGYTLETDKVDVGYICQPWWPSAEWQSTFCTSDHKSFPWQRPPAHCVNRDGVNKSYFRKWGMQNYRLVIHINIIRNSYEHTLFPAQSYECVWSPGSWRRNDWSPTKWRNDDDDQLCPGAQDLLIHHLVWWTFHCMYTRAICIGACKVTPGMVIQCRFHKSIYNCHISFLTFSSFITEYIAHRNFCVSLSLYLDDWVRLTTVSVNAGILGITSDSIFKINSYAYSAVATSSAACGLGIACDVWFLVCYNWVDSETFIVRKIPNPTSSHADIIVHSIVLVAYMVHMPPSLCCLACPLSACWYLPSRLCPSWDSPHSMHHPSVSS